MSLQRSDRARGCLGNVRRGFGVCLISRATSTGWDVERGATSLPSAPRSAAPQAQRAVPIPWCVPEISHQILQVAFRHRGSAPVAVVSGGGSVPGQNSSSSPFAKIKMPIARRRRVVMRRLERRAATTAGQFPIHRAPRSRSSRSLVTCVEQIVRFGRNDRAWHRKHLQRGPDPVTGTYELGR